MKEEKLIYIVTNPFIVNPEANGTRFFKIGITGNVKRRWNCGHKTDCPGRYKINRLYKITVPNIDADYVERVIFKILDGSRYSEPDPKNDDKLSSWEWFELTDTQRDGLFMNLDLIGELVSPEELEVFAQENDIDADADETKPVVEKKFSSMTLEQMGIPLRAKLYVSARKSRFAEVVENNKVKVDGEGEPMSLSAAARKILNYKSVSGHQYFMYDGRLLDTIQREKSAAV
ncbi:MAG: GIY-YIG nuclease family protein [Muribaculaceae bacterium]|nr:GIY-YIG nuclease family protein [Muribaculaceae bacterium]MCM1441036.1 GIY-YIG nuclease family protein [Roseburia sp.]